MKQNTKGPPVVKLHLISPSFDHWYKGELASSVPGSFEPLSCGFNQFFSDVIKISFSVIKNAR